MNIRAATADDLPAALYVWLAAEGEASGEPARAGDPVPSSLTHALDSGTMLVAEEDNRVVGFATAVTREPVTYLGQMFVMPDVQSGGVGRGLLAAVMSDDGRPRATVASSDPRAVGLYVRHGMRPFWPVFDLAASVESLPSQPATQVDTVEAEPNDPELMRRDAEIGGRRRPEDHAYWVDCKGGVPIWFERGGARLGYGYVLVQPKSAEARWYGESVRVGPIGVYYEADAVDCVRAALGWAREHGGKLHILVPGPHPALKPLLDDGFRINDIETFLSSEEQPFTDGRRYIPSGGGLF